MYGGLDVRSSIDVFIYGVVENEDRTLGRSYKHGDSEDANIALGHTGSGAEHPHFRELILNRADYVC
jgi:hypothetical protein